MGRNKMRSEVAKLEAIEIPWSYSLTKLVIDITVLRLAILELSMSTSYFKIYCQIVCPIPYDLLLLSVVHSNSHLFISLSLKNTRDLVLQLHIIPKEPHQ